MYEAKRPRRSEWEMRAPGRPAELKKRTQFGMLLAFLAFWAGVGMLHADDRFLWRSWGVRDGFTETYSYAVSMAPGEGAPTSATARYPR